jgi:hypothetical protein
MKALIDVDQLLEEYLYSQERLSNPHSERIMEYYSSLNEPVIIANLTRICSIVRKKDIQGAKAGTANLALYGPISVDVLVELKEKYDTVLKPPIVQTILKVMLQTLRVDSQELPLRSIKSCVEALDGEYINLLTDSPSL